MVSLLNQEGMPKPQLSYPGIHCLGLCGELSHNETKMVVLENRSGAYVGT